MASSIPVEPDNYLVLCPKCNSKTIARAITRTLRDDVENPWAEFWYAAVECEVCHEIMVVQQPRNLGGLIRKAPRMLWPRTNEEMSTTIPEALRREVGEAQACFRSAAYTATVVMVRRTLEGICVEHGLKSYPLFKALSQMKEQGLIEGRLLEWAEALRALGNDGAHFTGNTVSREDAQDALAFAAAILNYMYVFSDQFAEFKKRRQPPASEEHAHSG
jgi:hypothetical protein